MEMPTPAPNAAQAPEKNDTLLAVIAYVPFLFLLTLVQKGKDEFHLWHAKNGAILTLLEVLVYLTSVIVIRFVPQTWVVFGFINLALLIVAIIAAFKAWKGEKWNIPVVTSLAQKLPLGKSAPAAPPATQATAGPTKVSTPKPETKKPDATPAAPTPKEAAKVEVKPAAAPSPKPAAPAAPAPAASPTPKPEAPKPAPTPSAPPVAPTSPAPAPAEPAKMEVKPAPTPKAEAPKPAPTAAPAAAPAPTAAPIKEVKPAPAPAPAPKPEAPKPASTPNTPPQTPPPTA